MGKELVCGTHKSYESGCRCTICVSFIRQYHANWRVKNLEKKRESGRIWAQKNKDKTSEYNKKRYHENLEAERLRGKIYRTLNPEAGAARTRRRRAMKRLVEVSLYTQDQVLSLYGNTCYICNKKIDLNASRRIGQDNWENGLHIDHVVPISKGGGDTIKNVRPAHGLCNVKKGDRLNG